MHNFKKCLLSALLTGALLSAITASALAQRFTIDENLFRAIWNPLTITARSIIGTVEVRCKFTLEGSFHARTITKIQEALIGLVTRAIGDLGNCVGGKAEPRAASLPWHIRYEGFEGGLPNITRIRFKLTGAGFRILEPLNCDYTTSVANPGRFSINLEAGNHSTIITLEAEPGASIPSFTGPPCPNANFSGSGTVRNLAGTELIHVRLI